MNEVYITDAKEFFPNEAVSNDQIEDYLGLIGGKNSRSKNIVLRSNKIKSRHYALDKEGNSTHTNHGMASEAIKMVLKDNKVKPEDIDVLACGTSSPDQMMPAHGYMVHGEIPELGPVDTITMQGNCCSSVQAMKYAFMSIQTGQAHNAIVTGSERVSKLLRSDFFKEEADKIMSLEQAPILAFEKDFLRWMLSDAGTALLLQDKPSEKGLSFRIDWINSVSYAHEVDTCMYMGGEKNEDGSLRSFKEFEPKDIAEQSLFSMKQDVRLLDDNIVKLGFQRLADLFKNRTIKEEEITFFIPHMSSFFFQDKIDAYFKENDINMPIERWYTNLDTKGNIGSASIFSMLAELKEKDMVSKGDKLILAIPESARFSYVFAQLTVV